jgi:type III pantothenate kinase
MELMVDIGNTDTVLGLYKNSKLSYHWRLSSQFHRTEDECWVTIDAFFKAQQLDPFKINGVCLSSVVPELTLIYLRMVKKYLRIKPIVIGPDLNLEMRILYQDPLAVGADRICNAVAGKIKYGTPLIILDFGTATTFDCIDKNGNYLGGVICPGINNAADILHRKAAKLPKIDLRFPPRVIGRNTEESMQSGIMNGSVQMIEGLVKKIKKELLVKSKVIATGGLARIISKKTKSIDIVDDNLNIEGMYLIYKKNSN